MKHSVVGENSNISQNVVMNSCLVLGCNVKIRNNVTICTGVVYEIDIFLEPSMVFTNAINPKRILICRNDYLSTVVKKSIRIGANVAVVCENDIGKFSYQGAGTVEKKEVLDYSLVVGNPSQHIGRLSEYGHRLKFN